MRKHNPLSVSTALGAELRNRRKALGKTLTDIAAISSVNVGQLSRIENGFMKRDGGNLQIFLETLQKLESTTSSAMTLGVVERFAAVINRSTRHSKAATAFVDALEQLM